MELPTRKELWLSGEDPQRDILLQRLCWWSVRFSSDISLSGVPVIESVPEPIPVLVLGVVPLERLSSLSSPLLSSLLLSPYSRSRSSS